MHYKDLPPNTKLVTYDMLSDDVRAAARASVLKVDADAIARKIYNRKLMCALFINNCVNDLYTIPALIRDKKHLAAVAADPDLCAKYILGNLCHFTMDGTYVTYAIKS